MEHIGKFSIASMAQLNFDSSVFCIKIRTFTSFDTRVACELVLKNWSCRAESRAKLRISRGSSQLTSISLMVHP
jgi:hypothetical protein